MRGEEKLTGAVGPPPKDLNKRVLPLHEVRAKKDLYRVHHTSLGPVFFGPDKAAAPRSRFDAQSNRFGVLYISLGPDAAMIETLLRNPERLTVSFQEIALRSLSIIRISRTIKLVDVTGAGLSTLGLTSALFAGEHQPCRIWSDALFDHPQSPDGILYPSRHNPAETCIALFERKDIAIDIVMTRSLLKMPREVGALLDRHGKSLFGGG